MSETLTFAPLTSRALIALSGPDWRDFLQGLITQDVETLAPGEARFGALLTPQGRILFDLFVVGRQDGCWLDVLTEHRAAILQRLTMYRLRAKVEIAARTRRRSRSSSPRPTIAKGPAGFVRDPRLPALGWRGYGATAPAGATSSTMKPPATRAEKLRLGVPGPQDWGSDKTYPIEANFDLLERHRFPEGLLCRPGNHLSHETAWPDQEPHAAHRLRGPAAGRRR